ncbi:hypothetical protein BU24DRAFT_421258 [Aaosphaeria arxii CBS 175.79]|uniref:Uncharacterized protein n=1 Tax=Aaosphaeria arxii CBS 175.79 TaxID=1450172 RepID=A0A6A5XY67_9PLEO|nr:uncharacterized protein BU24DRAFT_421258 [Aaosphaeria arxii CBS 175.79]KAF2018265.1 hypothetical protein BU24DRAFT_421258 [Aaosphaeria arxii CBS 175.79]
MRKVHSRKRLRSSVRGGSVKVRFHTANSVLLAQGIDHSLAQGHLDLIFAVENVVCKYTLLPVPI